MNRRSFVKNGIGLAALLNPVVFNNDIIGAEPVGKKGKYSGKLDFKFLKREDSGYTADFATIGRDYTPLNKEIEILDSLTIESWLKAGLQEAIGKKISEMSKSGNGDFGAFFYSRNFGVPLDPAFVDEAESYCRNAQDYLLKNLRGYNKRFNWSRLNFGEKVEEGFKDRGLIIDGFYSVNRVEVFDTKDPKKKANIGSPVKSFGAYAVLARDEIVVSCNDKLLFSPFSEMVPFGLKEEFHRHIKQVGNAEALKTIEACSETVSRLIAPRFLGDVYDIDPAVARKEIEKIHASVFDKSKDRFNPVYEYVNRATELSKGDFQSAFDAYKKDPEKYRQSLLQ